MSYGSTILTQCEDLQARLDQFFQTCDASNLIEPTPFLDFILSDLNNTGLAQVVTPGDSKIRNINLTYFQRINEDNVKSNQANPNCDASTKRGNCVEGFTIDEDDNLQIEEKITVKDLNRVCMDNAEYFDGVVRRMIGVLVRATATKTMDESVLLTGKWDTQTDNINGATIVADVLEVRTTKSGAPEDVSPFTMQTIAAATMVTGYCDTPICFSDFDLWQYYDRVLAGCCADQGVDLGAIAREFGKVVMFDRRISTSYESGHAIVTQPRALTLLQYAQNEIFEDTGNRILQTRGTSFNHQVIFGPNGLKMDLNVSEQTCGDIDIVLTGTTKLVSLPDDIFGTGDSKDGVKFFNEIQVDNS